MKVSRLKETDLPELAQLYSEFWNEESSIQKMTETFHKIDGDARYQFLAVRDDEKIVGSLLGVFCDNLYGDCRPFVVIEDVIVSKECRRKGIGTMLVRKIEEIARNRNCENMIFVTEKDRKDAVSFYNSLGFEHDKFHGFKKQLR